MKTLTLLTLLSTIATPTQWANGDDTSLECLETGGDLAILYLDYENENSKILHVEYIDNYANTTTFKTLCEATYDIFYPNEYDNRFLIGFFYRLHTYKDNYNYAFVPTQYCSNFAIFDGFYSAYVYQINFTTQTFNSQHCVINNKYYDGYSKSTFGIVDESYAYFNLSQAQNYNTLSYLYKVNDGTNGEVAFSQVFILFQSSCIEDFRISINPYNAYIFYDDGFGDGFVSGVSTADGTGDVFNMIKNAFAAVSAFFNFQIAPNITIGLLFTIPLAVGVLLFVFKLLGGGD